MGTTILSIGHYTPERRITNDELERQLELEKGFIFQRTGIRERRYAAPNETLTGMAVCAAEMALSQVDFDKNQISLLLLATSTPDHMLPPSAPLIAHKLGLFNAGALDMAGACSGFLYSLVLADSYVRAHNKPVLLIAANILSRRTNLQDRASVILFSDAAGAVLIVPDKRTNSGILATELASQGEDYDLIQIAAGGSSRPFHPDVQMKETLMHIKDGPQVFSKTVRMMTSCSKKVLETTGLKTSDIRYCIPHQANARIMKAVQENLGFTEAQILSSISDYGNSSAATIPLTLSLHAKNGEFRPGDKLLLCAAGAGLTGGALLFGL
ncbi:MAG: beta-ketoacyl-ACP synthase III [Hyphomicrobium sp.]